MDQSSTIIEASVKEDVTIERNEENHEDLSDESDCEEVEEVDMNDPKMDPLEWGFRSVVSIPKKYYWETNKYDVSMRTKIWHRSIGTLGLTLRAAEKVGEALATVMGINSSRFNYITDHMNEEEWEQARQIDEDARERRKLADKEKKLSIQVV